MKVLCAANPGESQKQFELPEGSTPMDLAREIGAKFAERVSSVKVNDALWWPEYKPLMDGDVVLFLKHEQTCVRYRGEAIKAHGISLHPTGPNNYSWEKGGDKIQIQQEQSKDSKYWVWWAEIPLEEAHESFRESHTHAIERSHGFHLKVPRDAVKEALEAIHTLRNGET